MKVYLTKKNCGDFIVITSKYDENITIISPIICMETKVGIAEINAKSLYSVMNLELPKEYEVEIYTDDETKRNEFYKELENLKEKK